MVLLDDNGDKIHATVRKDLVRQFDPFLTEGQSKIFINFSLTHACGSYRTTSHQYRIGFLSTTRVKICQELPSALTGIQPVNYRAILGGSLNPDYLVDILGQIVQASYLDVVFLKGIETPKISLELRNTDDERLPVVLWGKVPSSVNEEIQNRGDDPLICVLRFGKIKVWKDDRSIFKAYNVSDVSLNPNMADVAHFVSLLPKDKIVVAIAKPIIVAMVPTPDHKDDFFVQTPRKTIVQLLD